MRDLLVLSIVLAGALAALRRPWIGVLLWTWLSLMSPHRYTYGMALTAPVTLIAAACTVLGLLFSREKQNPFQGSPVIWFLLFTVWVSISWLMGPDVSGQYDQWSKIMKINFMVIVTLAVIRTRFQINVYLIVCAMSLAILGAKGGVFTLSTGGNYRVWGPPDTFIGGNNEFALALIATIPLLRFMHLQMDRGWQRHAVMAMMILCAVAALGSHSRGALLAGVAMGAMLWWQGNRGRISSGILIVAIALAAVSFMPAEWFSRMQTIESYEEDRSALGRLAAWSLAWNSAFHHISGLGLDATNPDYFIKYSSYGLEFGTPVAHSIYFQVLGHHGFIGLALFIGIWVSTWRMASSLRRDAKYAPEAAWCADLGALAQVSLVGYLVGGAFLSLAYFDLPYNVMAMVLATRWWLNRKAWLTELPTRPIGLNMWRPATLTTLPPKA